MKGGAQFQSNAEATAGWGIHALTGSWPGERATALPRVREAREWGATAEGGGGGRAEEERGENTFLVSFNVDIATSQTGYCIERKCSRLENVIES